MECYQNVYGRQNEETRWEDGTQSATFSENTNVSKESPIPAAGIALAAAQTMLDVSVRF
jgi:hypothetical protein